MPRSTIRVQRNGKPVSGARVVLSFLGGQTEAAYKDSDGYANVSHQSSGEATIFVDGSESRMMRAPGTVSVTLK